MLAARQGAPPALLAQVIEKVHLRFLAAGLGTTWAQTLERVTAHCPQIEEHCPAWRDYLTAAWMAGGHWQQAQRWLTSRTQHPGDTQNSARLLVRQAGLLWWRGRWSQAYRLALPAWYLAVKHHDALLKTRTARLLLLITWRQGKVDEALHWGEQSLKACPATQSQERGRLLHRLYLVHLARKAYSRAEDLASQAQAHLEAAQDRVNLAHLWADLTDLYIQTGRLETAQEALYRAYQLWQAMDDPAGRADYYRHAARVALALGRPNQARELAHHALHLWKRLGISWEQHRIRVFLQRHWETAAA